MGKSPQERAVRRFQTESLHLHRNLFVAPSHDFEGSDQRFQSGEKDLEISPNGCRKEENGRVLVFSKICHSKTRFPAFLVPGPSFVCHILSAQRSLRRQGTFFQSAGLKLKEPLETWLKDAQGATVHYDSTGFHRPFAEPSCQCHPKRGDTHRVGHTWLQSPQPQSQSKDQQIQQYVGPIRFGDHQKYQKISEISK